MMVLHGVGVGGGSLGYAAVLEVPSEETFATPAWHQPLPWGEVLAPHYETARRMLGVAPNPRLWPADDALRTIARRRGREQRFRPTEVGIFFGTPGQRVEDPYFGGEGPARAGCLHCGGCMVGCRHNAKNTLPKSYLYLSSRPSSPPLPLPLFPCYHIPTHVGRTQKRWGIDETPVLEYHIETYSLSIIIRTRAFIPCSFILLRWSVYEDKTHTGVHSQHVRTRHAAGRAIFDRGRLGHRRHGSRLQCP
ncbi:MAG: hypothetical protein Q9O62_12555 [Ardenticatenia bacterium]|nr:hypothetical protein [Ardenticatenia bacterium]